MIGSIKAVGDKRSVRKATDVFATDGRDGKGIGKAKQTAAAKSSLWVTYGEKNRVAGVVTKTTATAQNLADRLLHRDSDLVSGVELGRQNGLPEPNV